MSVNSKSTASPVVVLPQPQNASTKAQLTAFQSTTAQSQAAGQPNPVPQQATKAPHHHLTVHPHSYPI